MPGDPITNGELEHVPLTASAPVRVLEPRSRALAVRPSSGTLVATAGGLLAAATVVTVRAARARRRSRRRGRRRDVLAGRVVASRSFLVDVHLVDR